MDEITTKIGIVLGRHLGLSPGSLGTRMIESAIRRRMELTQSSTPQAYAMLVESSRVELDELTEAVVVPETWFFRYPESFTALTQWAIARRGKNGTLRQFRVLSAPCSTGEEPYSIAMALLNAGLSPGSFRVEALDISKRVIEFAKVGVYSSSAFRESGAIPTTRFVDVEAGNHTIRPEVRQSVSFRVGNLTDPKVMVGEPLFDAIFCRNLFIYLTDVARRSIVSTFDRLLYPDGLVFAGHAEPLGLIDGRYKSAGTPQAFAFTRTVGAPASHVPPLASAFATIPPLPDKVVVNTILSKPLPPLGGPSTRSRSDGPVSPSPSSHSTVKAGAPEKKKGLSGSSTKMATLGAQLLLEKARAAANAGQVAEATAICEQLAKGGANADTFALLGVLRATAGELVAAERNFTQALYIDPAHYDSLIHMMVMAQNRGDLIGAANYRRRADAASKREGR